MLSVEKPAKANYVIALAFKRRDAQFYQMKFLNYLCLVFLSSCAPPDGAYESFHDNGQLSERGTYIEGNPDGLVEGFDENGQLRLRGNYIDGELDGLWEGFYESGQLRWRGNFIDEQREGLFENFDENGNLTRTRTYSSGELVEVN